MRGRGGCSGWVASQGSLCECEVTRLVTSDHMSNFLDALT